MTNGAQVPATTDARWQVYMILCVDGCLYTGITTEVGRRFAEHAAGRGARFFRGRQPQRLVYLETGHSHGSAARREHAIKRMSRSAKQALIASWTPDSSGLDCASRVAE